MAELTVSFDGWSSTNVGFHVTNPDSYRMSPPREWAVEQAPYRPSGVLMSQQPRYDARELVVEGRLTGTGSTDYRAKRDELVARLDRDSEVEVSFSDSTGRIFFARFLALEASHRSMALANSDDVSLSFLLRRPWAYDASTTSTTGIGSTAVDIALGTAPTFDATLRVQGASTNPTITYADSAGTEVHTLSLTASVGAGDFIDIDMRDGTIVGSSGNSRVADLDTGSDFPWALDPRDGEHWNSSWPTLKVDSGTLKATIRKAYS